MNYMNSNIIIGAGIACLPAVYELSKLGQKATIPEDDKFIGGIVRTANYNGAELDIGKHSFFPKVSYLGFYYAD